MGSRTAFGLAVALLGCNVDDVVGRYSTEVVSNRDVELSCGSEHDLEAFLNIGEQRELGVHAATGNEWRSSRAAVADVDASGVVSGLSEGTTLISAHAPDGRAMFVASVTVGPCQTLCVEFPAQTVNVGDTQPLVIRNLTGNDAELSAVGGRLHEGAFVEATQSGSISVQALARDQRRSAEFQAVHWLAMPAEPAPRAAQQRLRTGGNAAYLLDEQQGVYAAVKIAQGTTTEAWQWEPLASAYDGRRLERTGDGAEVPDGPLVAVLQFNGLASRAYRYDALVKEWRHVPGLDQIYLGNTTFHVVGDTLYALAGSYAFEGEKVPALLAYDPQTDQFQLVAVALHENLELRGFDEQLSFDGTWYYLRVRLAVFRLNLDGTDVQLLSLPSADSLAGYTANRRGRPLISIKHDVYRLDDAGWSPLDRSALPVDSNPGRGRPSILFQLQGEVYMRNLFWDTFRLEGDVFVPVTLFPELPSGRLPEALVLGKDSRFYAVVQGDESQPFEAFRSPLRQLEQLPPAPADITLSVERDRHWVGHPVELQRRVEGDGPLLWSSSNAAIAAVNSSGVVQSLRAGSAKLSAIAENDPSVSSGVELQFVDPADVLAAVDLRAAVSELRVGGDTLLTAKPIWRDCDAGEGLDAGTLPLTWRSNNPDVATVEDGRVVARGAGSATISAAWTDAPRALGQVQIDVSAP